MRLTAFALLLIPIALGACDGGDDELSADEYGSRIAAACERLVTENARIPQRVQDEDLEITDAQEIARENGEEFEDTVRELEPPEELRDAHDELLRLGEEPPPSGEDTEALRELILRFADVYETLGASKCERSQRVAARNLAEAPAP